MLLKLTTLACASFALATSAQQLCYSQSKYSLTMLAGPNRTVTTLHALDTGTADEVILVAGSNANAPGTPVCETGVSPNVGLKLEVTNVEPLTSETGTFHLYVADMGEVRGAASTVSGSSKYDWPHWSTGIDEVWPEMTSAAQLFFACDISVKGKQYTALSWGLFNSTGGNPPGCYSTVVRKKYDVQVPC